MTEEKKEGVNFLSIMFMFQAAALQALGEIPNPLTGKAEKDLLQAKYSIDTLTLLKEKTKGNLEEGEAKILDEVLYGLRMRFVESTKEPTKKPEPEKEEEKK